MTEVSEGPVSGKKQSESRVSYSFVFTGWFLSKHLNVCCGLGFILFYLALLFHLFSINCRIRLQLTAWGMELNEFSESSPGCSQREKK